MDSSLVVNPEVCVLNSSRLLITSVGDSFLLWFESSRQFLLIEEPAYFVLRAFLQDQAIDAIAIQCSDRYGISLSECQSFVVEVDLLLKSLQTEKIPYTVSEPDLTHQSTIEYRYKTSYLLGEKVITIRYQDARMHHLIHPLLSHHETNTPSSDCTIDLYRTDRYLNMVTHTGEGETWPETDIPHFKGAVMGQILNYIYQKNETDWLLTMHASGVANGRSAVLFSAAAGSGKSTIAAMLQARGYDLLSDDFIAVDQEAKAYRFPMAISVKEGAYAALTGFYPELVSVEPVVASNGKSVRFLSPYPPKSSLSAFPVKAIVFVRYAKDGVFDFSKTTSQEAVKLLLPEIFVHPDLCNIQQFMQWISRVTFYTLTYSDSQAALEAIDQLFEHEK